MAPDQIEHIRHLWEDTDRTAKQIAAMYGVSRGAITGMANRRWWTRPGVEKTAPSTLFQRCDVLHARMDAVLAESRAMQAAHPGKTGRDDQPAA